LENVAVLKSRRKAKGARPKEKQKTGVRRQEKTTKE
jgi:hypothetical protein